MFPLSTVLIGAAVAVDCFAGGVWLGHRWGTSSAAGSLQAAVKEAVARATTLPAGGLPTIAKEVADEVTAVGTSVTQVAGSVSQVAGTVKQTSADVNAALDAALALTKK